MNTTAPAPTPSAVPRRGAAWAGAGLYFAVLVLLVGGAPLASGGFHALGSLLAVSLLTGLFRRAPAAAWALTLVGSLAVLLTGTDPGPDRFLTLAAVDVALGVVVATRRGRIPVAAGAVTLTAQFLSVGLFWHRPGTLVGTAVIALMAMVTSCAVGMLARERREHTVALRSQEVAEAVTAERLRIARELHDMVAHSIGIIAIQAGVGSRVIETQPAEAREALRNIESTSRETLSGLRRTLVALRQAGPVGEPAAAPGSSGRAPREPAPGLADLDRLAAATADAGVRVDVRRRGEPRPLPADIELSAYRIVQEALTNVVRHAGTGSCRVTVDYGEEELSVEVVDDGRGTAGGAAPDGQGFGLVGMRERAGLLHGTFSAGPRPEGGFRVAAGLPVPERVLVPEARTGADVTSGEAR
ncbi:sensor histidine kinase [Streptomyces albireticuli]|uniref:histidine kinase n=1 Tax=Streptomyces albireticuli TaxID=1940 RepID=A0A2A2D752_9ACTN|nr:sensor histidine kinase [Streptomyces albireticuli]MCD9143068.1 sensor histidine kinase [Streptomyces albireticuli]MCD9165311.1 sensor histidine kinase [Streptomyces albireticuli]MCD9192171.1 sensor histidine kinase [Streptomyces albireticuli]PAU47152.1 two-component sensor histidine kinase [Streptomyces albireticuli]